MKKILLTLSTVFITALCTEKAFSQEQSKTTLTLAQRQKLFFRDSIGTRVKVVKQRYQQQIDSIIASPVIDGKQKWLQMNALSKQRNLNLRQVNDRVKQRNTVLEIKK